MGAVQVQQFLTHGLVIRWKMTFRFNLCFQGPLWPDTFFGQELIQIIIGKSKRIQKKNQGFSGPLWVGHGLNLPETGNFLCSYIRKRRGKAPPLLLNLI